MAKRAEDGFSFIELAVVLTVIGLITGAFMVGQAMIRSAQLNSIITDIGRYSQAVADFRDKYQGYPGDLPNATQYWGVDPGGCPTITTGAGGTPWNATPHIATCNGDGNGLIGPLGVLDNGGYVAAGPGAYEWYRAWQQLADAGFIEGSYNGIMGPSGTNNSVIGTNVPTSRIVGAGYNLFYAANPAGDTNWFPIMNHVIAFGNVNGTGWTNGPAITTGEAFGIDSKLDDGTPATGKIRSFKTTVTPNCATSNLATAQYKSAYTSVACSLVFDLGY